jgi:hypothetical protein
MSRRGKKKLIECSSPEGITIGAIEAIITLANIVDQRLPWNDMMIGEGGDEFQPIRDALTDLCSNGSLRKILDGWDNRAHELIHRAAKMLEEKVDQK